MSEDEQQTLIARLAGVTVAREYGSGGGEIAARLAERLGWHLVDHEIVEQAARALELSEDEADECDESTPSLVERMLLSMNSVQSVAPVTIPPPRFDARGYHEVLVRILRAAIAERHVVIVGRGAQMLLADRPDVLRVLVVAPFDLRVAYVMRREGLDRAAAAGRVRTKDRNRIRYVETFYHRNPLDPRTYDLAINTAVLDLDSVVELTLDALVAKARKLDTPPDQLGPAAGLAPYPTAPRDFSVADRPDSR